MRMRTIYFVRTADTVDDATEELIIERFGDVLASYGSAVLTTGRQYFHDTPLCCGHPDKDEFC